MPRDKFAALASRATENSSSDAARDTAPLGTPAAPAVAAPAQPKRDKLAALASRGAAASGPSAGRGNKLAAMQAKGSATESVSSGAATPKTEEELATEKRMEAMKDRLSKRKEILANLDRAEDLTCQLLEIAHQTTDALQDLTCGQDISALSKAYRQTIQELHPLLNTNTHDLIRPYQNHTRETKQSMYSARVEMRLANERTQVLQAFTELEGSQQQAPISDTVNANKKRARDEEDDLINKDA